MARLARGSARKVCARRGITITEILTVGAIVVTLAAVTVPSIRAASAMGKQAQCATNLRGQASALTNFAMENNGHLLGGSRLMGATDNYYYHLAQSTTPKTYAMGMLVKTGYLKKPVKDLFCPAQENPKFQYKDSYGDMTTFNVDMRVGYSSYANPAANSQWWQSLGSPYNGSKFPWNAGNYTMPSSDKLEKLVNFSTRAIQSDAVQLYNDVDLCHQTGMNVAYGDGSVIYVDRQAFDGPLSQLVHSSGLDNAASLALWKSLDAAK